MNPSDIAPRTIVRYYLLYLYDNKDIPPSVKEVQEIPHALPDPKPGQRIFLVEQRSRLDPVRTSIKELL